MKNILEKDKELNGVEFGVELKKIREEVKVSAETLSDKLNKSRAYVSSIENGRILVLKYSIAYQLLKYVNFPIDMIESYLNKFILEQEEDSKEVKKNRNTNNTRNPDRDAFSFPWLYESETSLAELRRKLLHINMVFSSLIERDYTRAERVIDKLYELTNDKKSLDLLCSVLELETSLEPPTELKVVENQNG